MSTATTKQTNIDGIEILYWDKDIIVANKPAGMLTVPGRGPDKQDCLISQIVKHFEDALIVHRLDMATSGIVLIARGADNHRNLSKQFQNRETDKSYVAVIYGLLDTDSGRVDLPLICDWPNRPKQMVCFENGKPSLTHFRVLERNIEKNISRVELTPITGRSHQLRVHMLAINHVICGDELYAQGAALEASPRLLLHAQQLQFSHPNNDKKMSFFCPASF